MLVKLTQEEILEKGRELSQTLQECYETEQEKKSAMADFKAVIEEKKLKIFQLSNCIRTKTEEREDTLFPEMINDASRRSRNDDFRDDGDNDDE